MIKAGDNSDAPAGTVDACARALIAVMPLAVRFMISEIREQGGPQNLTPPQFRILAFLREAPGASLTVLADHLGVRAPTASVMMLRLVRQRLVRRKVDAKERRRVVLELTEKGVALIDRTRDALIARLKESLVLMSDHERDQLAQGLDRLRTVLEAASAHRT